MNHIDYTEWEKGYNEPIVHHPSVKFLFSGRFVKYLMNAHQQLPNHTNYTAYEQTPEVNANANALNQHYYCCQYETTLDLVD